MGGKRGSSYDKNVLVGGKCKSLTCESVIKFKNLLKQPLAENSSIFLTGRIVLYY